MAANPYFSLAVLFFAALGFGLAPLGLAALWGKVFSPAKPNATKNAIYECGLESKGDAWVQFRSAYYLYGIMSVLAGLFVWRFIPETAGRSLEEIQALWGMAEGEDKASGRVARA